MKKHFTDEIWFDFERGTLARVQRDVLQHHLDGGCESCTKRHNIWKVIAEAIGREAQYQPAAPAVRVAKSYAAILRSYLLAGRAKMLPLVFDSFLDRSAVTVRGPQMAARHLLHRTRSWAVDLRLEKEGRGMSIAGQVMRSGGKSGTGGAWDVVLMQGDTLLAQTSTNPVGEFELQCQNDENLKIYLDIPGRQPLGVALPAPVI